MAAGRIVGRLKQLSSALAFSSCLLRFTPAMRAKVHMVSGTAARRHGNGGQKKHTSFSAAGRLLVGGGVFLWDRERIHDWEIDECVAGYERRNNGDGRQAPPYRLEKEISTEDMHTSPNKRLRLRRRDSLLLDDIPEKIAQMREKVKNFVGSTLKDVKGQFAFPPLSRDFPPLVHRLFYRVLPPSSLFPSMSHRPALSLQPSPQCTDNNGCLLCQQFLRLKRPFHHNPQLSTDQVLLTSLQAALEQFTGQGRQSSSLSTAEDHRQGKSSGGPWQHNLANKRPSQQRIDSGAVSSPLDSLSCSERRCTRASALSNRGRHRGLHQIISEAFNRFNEEFYVSDHTHFTPSLEDYPTLDYRMGSHHLDPAIMSETLQKWASAFSESEERSVCHSLGDFPCGEDLRISLDGVGGGESGSGALTSSGAVSVVSTDDNCWDPYLQVPHVSLVNHCHISSLTEQLSSIASCDEFVPVIDASVFSDSFLAFDQEVQLTSLRRVPEGALFELGPLQPAMQGAAEMDGGIPEEAMFYVATLPGEPSSPVAMTTVNGEAPWQLLLTQGSIKVYRRPYPGASVFQYKVTGSCDDISAADFVDVQMDTNVRLQWDSYLSEMDVVDRDTLTGTDLLHWVIKLPFPLRSRDYVFVRRLQVKRNGTLLVLINRSVQHPRCPETTKHVRVTDYFSEMIVEATNGSVKKNGFRYELMYLDDPKCTVPSYIANWATTAGIPDLMSRAHGAAAKRSALEGQRKEVLHGD